MYNSSVTTFFPTAEGYYDYEKKTYIYQYKDHLGNTRISYVTGNENYIADGIVKIDTDYNKDSSIMMALDSFEKYNTSYNGVKCNCSDYVEEALLWTTSKSQDVDEKFTNTIKATTPNKVYKAAKSLPNSKVLRDPGKKVDTGFIDAVAGDNAAKARKKMD